jgi:aspartate kinase
VVVQKFGGTSVADPEAIQRLIQIVGTARSRDGRGPAVVVSAMSGVTDALLALAAAAGGGRLEDALARIQQLRERHIAVARALAAKESKGSLGQQIEAHFDDLTALARALGVLREVSPRTLDVVAAVGELLSSRIVAAALAAAGLPSDWVDARRAIITNGDHTRALPLSTETEAALRASVLAAMDAGRIPVLGGFIGSTIDGHTTTLGRGGSDYSGAIVGAAVGAREIQIWTDVDGMLTADPRVIAAPRLVPSLSFAEAAELAYFGAKVLHPSTILPAVERNIPVRILNSRKANGSGTTITAEPPPGATPLTALACKRDVTVVDITSACSKSSSVTQLRWMS